MSDVSFVSLEHICKSFGGVPVLKDVDFDLKEGEIHALVGGNGAGKSTLMKILNGVYRKDSGVVRIRGEEVEYQTIQDAWKHGIRMIFQELSLSPTLSVMDNIFLTREEKKGILLDKKKMRAETETILERLNIDAKPNDIIADLSVGTCQLIEIAKALSTDATVLILDEPTASLTDRETKILFDRMRSLKEKGISFTYISHRMKEIFQISDRISVLKDGKMVKTAPTSEISMQEVISYISAEGGDLTYKGNSAAIAQNEELFRVEHLSVSSSVHDVSFGIRKGEVVGIAGLMGSGRTETAEAIFGIRRVGEGSKFFLEGKQIRINSVKDAIRSRIALVPEDRRREGLVLEHTLEQNLCLPNLNKIRSGIFTDNKKAAWLSAQCVEQLAVKASGVHAPIVSLSGGNQQKIVVAKWLETKPKLLIMDEPTAGVDIGAKAEIIEIVRKYAAEGNAALFISSEMSELLAACDRILVYCNGRLTEQYQRENIDSEEMLEHAIQQ